MTTNAGNISERFIGQLDALVAFLALAHDEVFEVVRSEYDSWVPRDQQNTLPSSSQIYQTQVSHAAFLLGFSYFEAFLSDLMRVIFRSRPEMLPRDKKISFGEVLNTNSVQDVVGLLIEKEVQDVMFGSFESIATYFKNRLNLNWSDFARLAEARALRNCIVHNMARADSRLVSAASQWTVGEQIELTPSVVHGFGLEARRFARALWEQVERQLPSGSRVPDPNQRLQSDGLLPSASDHR